MARKNSRRAFISKAVKASALVIPGSLLGFQAFGTEVKPVKTQDALLWEAYLISVSANLFDAPRHLELQANEYSDPIDLGERGIYRIKIERSETPTVFGQGYVLTLGDISGNALDTKNVVNSTTAIFRRYGVQVHMVTFQGTAPS
jgi:hypothetical protein